MLKIKDDVDLKELEKFGFEIVKNMWLPRYTRNYVDIYYDLPQDWLDLNVNKKRLRMQAIIERGIVFEEDVPKKYRESLIHDLIQAGLVEKG